MKIKNVKLKNKIIFLAVFIIIVFSAMIGFYIIPTVSNIIEERTMVKLTQLVDLPYSEIQRQYDLYKNGDKSEEDAKQEALRFVENLRYSETEYFWVNDMDGMMLMHPIALTLVDTNVLGLKDPDGYLFFQAMIDIVKKDDEGIIRYQWPKPGKEEPQPKISFVKGFDDWKWLIGTGVYVDDLQEIKKDIYFSVVIISVVIILFSLMLITLIVIPLNKTLREILLHTKQYEALDFREKININSSDELGLISSAFNSVSEGLRNLLENMVQTSTELTKDSEEIAREVKLLEESTGLTLESTTDISAVIEETTAAATTVTHTVDEIRSAIEVVAEKATEGAHQAGDVSSRASKLKIEAVQSGEHANGIYNDVKGRLESAISDAKQVSKINDLLEGILSITSQTNLLALNASIEAARAGDAGKGFAVVANEVGKLADESSTLVENIQKTVDFIQKSVNTLISDSSEILDFIESDVLKDYKKLSAIGDQYSDDADIFNGIMMELSAISEQLTSSIESIATNMHEVQDATDQESQGVENILHMTKDITDKTIKVNEIIQVNIDMIKELDQLINQFSI
ncbi:MAG: methyl-accepting chemotaxis protein [Clostridiales bacterium]|nr:methyl-accepting chemotaxis protein [Clostridiales bacterium]